MNLRKLVSRMVRGGIFLPQTLYINLVVLPFEQGKKFPVIVMGPVRTKGINRGTFIINGRVKTGMIRIGALKTGKRGLNVNKWSTLSAENGGKIEFCGSASFGRGSAVCASGGKITFGNKFSCNINCFIYSQNQIEFGEDVLLGWNINIRDNDGHPLYDSDQNIINNPKIIHISDHSWIGSYVDILKGVNLPKGTIVSTRSVVTKSLFEENAVIAGIPAKTVKNNIYWAHNTDED